MKLTKRFKKIILIIGVILIYNLLFQSFYDLMTENSLYPYATFPTALKNYVYNLIPTTFLFIIDWVIVFQITRYKGPLEIKFTIDFILTSIALFLVNEMYILALPMFDARPRVNWGGTFFCNIFIMIGVETVYYVNRYKQLSQHKEHAQRMASQLRYNVLKSQINPHFLFNSLNILYSLISIDAEKSKSFVLALSQMYRYIMQHQNAESVLMQDEIVFLKSYVDILKMRYGDCFDVEITGIDNIQNNRIIPYTMQLLVENVTKHNIISKQQPIIVAISITNRGLTIQNPIHPKISESHSQIGISYLTQLYSLHGTKFYTQNDGKIFTAYVPFLKPS